MDIASKIIAVTVLQSRSKVKTPAQKKTPSVEAVPGGEEMDRDLSEPPTQWTRTDKNVKIDGNGKLEGNVKSW